jgi:putative transposase
MRLKPDEFIRRVLLHILPDGFHRIRYFGFMVNGHRAKNIALCRALLVDEEAKPETDSSSPDPVDNDAIDSKRVCPDCGGAMRFSSAFFPVLGDAMLPHRHFDATRYETAFDDFRNDQASPKTLLVVSGRR